MEESKQFKQREDSLETDEEESTLPLDTGRMSAREIGLQNTEDNENMKIVIQDLRPSDNEVGRVRAEMARMREEFEQKMGEKEEELVD